MPKKPHPAGQWISVESANLSEVKYDPTLRMLTIRFHGAPLDYLYVGVTDAEFQGLCNADSVGKYFHRFIKAKQTFKEITKS